MQGDKYVILCVDDDPEILDWLRITLETKDYMVVTAENAEDGVKKFKDSSPDFIIVDLMMEEIDSGTDFVTKLKSMGNSAPIFMLSAAGNELSQTTDYSELGLDGVFQKPLDNNVLLTVLKNKLH